MAVNSAIHQAHSVALPAVVVHNHHLVVAEGVDVLGVVRGAHIPRQLLVPARRLPSQVRVPHVYDDGDDDDGDDKRHAGYDAGDDDVPALVAVVCASQKTAVRDSDEDVQEAATGQRRLAEIGRGHLQVHRGSCNAREGPDDEDVACLVVDAEPVAGVAVSDCVDDVAVVARVTIHRNDLESYKYFEYTMEIVMRIQESSCIKKKKKLKKMYGYLKFVRMFKHCYGRYVFKDTLSLLLSQTN